MTPRYTLLIVTWNGDSLLADCLSSLVRALPDVPPCVVVDNANAASTRTCCGNFPFVTYVPAPENLGFAGGNNLGLPHCHTDYICLLNNDTIIHTDSFAPLVEFLDAHPRVGIVQGTMNVPALGNGLDDCGVLMTPFGIQRHLHRGEPTATTRLKPRKVFAAKGAMMMFRRKVLEDTRFLFYDHFKSYYEETDFCHRARLAGWETWFVPTPPIDHLGGQTSGRLPTDEVFARYFRNILYSFHHNFGFWGHVFTIPCFFCAALLRYPRPMLKAIRG